ncbi:membrane dipeptidase [Paenibacillus darwinianus]|uniref:Membrane dipeptidase n=1 Tax=Paenibacillus darwinianus TaxID=1380763 RepID=A0A9W5S340_9BACL|nr:dipeptidase [Paenibacillus darwinianus]EXX91152.1 membrane dipeptidase [Paenibacillus darwinianus]EXX92055.1 membrane dipeptidase [Paenibacillus darwinianus]EXX92771.1 membrane dipeptidase [Paenibacillus darwinianus]
MRNGTFDLHCDVLSKLLTGEATAFAGTGSEKLDVTYEKLIASDAWLQTYAIYLPESYPSTFSSILQCVDLFYRHIASRAEVAFVRSAAELQAAVDSGRLGAMLSLEGADGLQGDFTALRILYYLGVRSLGLTWNYANWAADGVMEPRGGGLTRQGRKLVQACNGLGILLDVSHLSESGFWDVADLTDAPVIASHSNAKSACDHPRNLSDDQIRAIIAMGGLIGITFVPWFVSNKETVTIDDLLPHIDRILSLGGEKTLAFGSDFDGIDRHMTGLADPTGISPLRNELEHRYGDTLAMACLRDNALRFFLKQLPK